MNAITVLNKSNVPTGPFTRAQVAEKLQAGEFSLEDLAFMDGLAQWTPLREILAKVDAAAMPASAPVVAPPSFISPPVTSPSAPPAYSYAAAMQPPTHLLYGGFWLRFVAYLIDSLILGIPIMMILAIIGVIAGSFAALTGNMGHGSGGDNSDTANAALPIGIILLELVFFVVFAVLGWLYFAFLESGPHQATFGKRAMGLKVTNMAGARISFGHASGRFFSKIVSGLIPFAIGYIMAGFTERKQALHDLIAGTLVIRG